MKRPGTEAFFPVDRSSRPNPKERGTVLAVLSRARAFPVSDQKGHSKIGSCLAIAGPVAKRGTGRQNALSAKTHRIQVLAVRKLPQEPL